MSCVKSSIIHPHTMDVMVSTYIHHLHTEADPFQRAAPSGLALTFCLPHFSRGHLGAPQPSPISTVILSLMLIWQIRLSNPHHSLCMSNQSQPWGSHRVSHSVEEQLALWKENSNRWHSFTRSLFHLLFRSLIAMNTKRLSNRTYMH